MADSSASSSTTSDAAAACKMPSPITGTDSSTTSGCSSEVDASASIRGDSSFPLRGEGRSLMSAYSHGARASRMSTLEPSPSKRKSRPDSPLPVDSPCALSVRSLDLTLSLASSSSSSSRGWGNVRAEEGRVAEKAFCCQVCLEDRPAGSGFPLSVCGHTFCRACLKGYVTSKVNDGQVYPTCFHTMEGKSEEGGDGEDSGGGGAYPGVTRGEKCCSAVISKEDIEALLASDRRARRKYARFLFCREHETARECPRCGKLQVGDPSNVEMRCSSCWTEFCYEHGGAHEGRSCAAYVESTADETGRTLALIGRLTKPCPGCKTPVEKLGGCNQMICYHCSASFCWICGQEVDRGTFPVHFQWWNVRGCPNQQLQEDTHEEGGGRQCHRVLSILQIVIVGPAALALTIASSLACLCCLPAFKLSPRQLFTGCFSGWGNCVMMLPILPFVLVGAATAALVYLILLPFKLGSVISRKYRLRSRHGGGIGSSGGAVSINAGGRSSSGGTRTGEAGRDLGSLESGVDGASVQRRDKDSDRAAVGDAAGGAYLPSPLADVLWAERRHRWDRRSIVLGQLQEEDRRPRLDWSYLGEDSSKSLGREASSRVGRGDVADGGQAPARGEAVAVAVPQPTGSPLSQTVVAAHVGGRGGGRSRSSSGTKLGADAAQVGGGSSGRGAAAAAAVTTETGFRMPGIVATTLGVREMLGIWLGASPVSSVSPAGSAAVTAASAAATAATAAEDDVALAEAGGPEEPTRSETLSEGLGLSSVRG